MAGRVVARTVVTLSLSIPSTDSWGPETEVQQIHRQASAEAIRWVQSLMRNATVGAEGKVVFPIQHAQIVGDPKVSIVTIEEMPNAIR